MNSHPFQRISDDDFLEVLRRHLTDLPDKEIRFFANPKRFRLMRALIGAEIENEVRSILNVACGPFAFENYVPFNEDVEIDAFDLNPLLQGVFEDLKIVGLLRNGSYVCSDAEAYSTDKKYDLVLINDLFYHKAVDFEALIGKFADRVKTGGILYFDILDKRSGRLWQALGKDEQFVRYDLSAVSEKLKSLDFEVESVTPALGIGGIVDFTARSILYRTARLANNFIFVVRKK